MFSIICEVIKKFISVFKHTNELDSKSSANLLVDLQEEILEENQNTEFLQCNVESKKVNNDD